MTSYFKSPQRENQHRRMHGCLASQRAAVHEMHFLVHSLNHLLFLLTKYLLEVFDDDYFAILKNNFLVFANVFGIGGGFVLVLFFFSSHEKTFPAMNVSN